MKIRTIGHSTRSFDELKAALVAHRIELLADVRAFPSSRRHPHLKPAELEVELPKAGIAYEWLGVALGGRRKASRDTPNIALHNDGFRGYADHMASQSFRDAIHALIERAAESRVAIMCAEQLWWRCHRSIISNYLLGVGGLEIEHIYDARRAESHRLNRLARVEKGALIYDRNETGRLL
jgi:uncharacterized protein (DUF488 family)